MGDNIHPITKKIKYIYLPIMDEFHLMIYLFNPIHK